MMSASAVKSSIPGVGPSAPAPAHSMHPMNVMAQKVAAGETGKPLGGGGLSYVTLQPANQPLSLVQDRPTYPNPLYVANSVAEKEKEPEADKIVQNGVEAPKATEEAGSRNAAPLEQTQNPPVVSPAANSPSKLQTDTNRNNNLSPDNSTAKEDSNKAKTELETSPETTEIKPAPTTCSPGHNKIEEKKTTPVKNGSKPETAIIPAAKVSPHKPEEQPQIRPVEFKVKPIGQLLANVPTPKPSVESPLVVPVPKVEQKITNTPRTVKRKARELKDLKGTSGEGGSKPKRNRVQTQPYQSPLPEIALIVKTLNKTPSTKNPDDKLIVFYKNEFLAVRNAEGSFYVCQAMQNIYKSSRRIRIRWLSQDKNNGEIYSPDFYDFTDFDCILTNLNLNKIDKNKFQLTKFELLRTENILKRAIDVEAGVSEKPRVTEEHPDGLDLSLYKDESQLKRRKRAAKEKQRFRKRSKRADSSDESSSSSSSSDEDDEPPKKSSPKTTSRVKKRSTNKALAIAKSVAKGPNRAKRALNRAAASAQASLVGNNANSTAPATDIAKRNQIETNKKNEAKRIIGKQNVSGPSRTTKRGSIQVAQETRSIAGRAKRLAVAPTTTGTATAASTAGAVAAAESTASTEDSSSRKKPRTTRA